MNIIESIKIDGLWGRQDSKIKIKFDKNFNFLIGQNGTGKTTIINLLAAALSADFERLDKIQFSKICIYLHEVVGKKKPSIEITKTEKSDVPYYDIQYKIKLSSRERPINFDLDAFAEEQFYRGMPPRILRERLHREKFLDVKHQLKSMLNLCWLSIHRHNEENRAPEERKNIPSVDQKLQSLNNEFIKFFSRLSRIYAEQAREFQKQIFLSLLNAQNEQSIIGKSQKINVDQEKTALGNVFDILGVESAKYIKPLNIHFQRFEDARKMLAESKLNTHAFAAILSALKTHTLVQYYEELNQKREEIFKPRTDFLKVINELFDTRKTISISEKNEIVIEAPDGRSIPLEELSSGEKQLLIILGEAMLQDKSSVVYIADEPELSLHIKWQEKLTSSISKLNPNTQIIFATHSPDIVSIYSDNVINMESIV